MISAGGSSGPPSVSPGRGPSSWICTLPSSATRPTCSFLMALSSAARGTGCVTLGRALRCSMLRMCRFTASTMSVWPEEDDEEEEEEGEEEEEEEEEFLS